MKAKRKYQHSAFVSVGGIMKRIDVDAIVFIEAQSYKCVFNMEDGTKYKVSMPMGEAIEDMDEEQIVRIHRSFSVNIDQIDEYYGGMVKMYGGKEIPIGREYKSVFEEVIIILRSRNRRKVSKSLADSNDM